MSQLLINAYRYAVSIVASTFSGSFITTASTATVTSATRTYTLGAGNSGQVQFTTLYNEGAGNIRYSKNGAAAVTINEGDIITLANSDTLAVSVTGMASTNIATFTIKDVDTNTTIENVQLQRS